MSLNPRQRHNLILSAMGALEVLSDEFEGDDTDHIVAGIAAPQDGGQGAAVLIEMLTQRIEDQAAEIRRYKADSTTYQIPGAPPTETKVASSKDASHWTRLNDGMWARLGYVPDGTPHTLAWVELLDLHGPVWIVDRSAQDLADDVLYGPPGARWGNPQEPCPFSRLDPLPYPYAEPAPGVIKTPCSLGRGHTGPHRSQDGAVLFGGAEPDVSGLTGNMGVVGPQEPCTCGHPAAHQPGCPRHTRISGAAFLADGHDRPSSDDVTPADSPDDTRWIGESPF